MSSPVSYDLQGQGGGVVLGSGSTQSSATGDFRWIQVITDAVLGSINSANLAEGSALAGPTLVAGLGIGGRFSQITVNSGLVIAYYA